MGWAGGEGARTSLFAIYPTKGCVSVVVGRSDINGATAFTAHVTPAIIQKVITHISWLSERGDEQVGITVFPP